MLEKVESPVAEASAEATKCLLISWKIFLFFARGTSCFNIKKTISIRC